MKFAVVVFPGSNCDADCFHALREVTGAEVEYIWHKEEVLEDGYDCIVLPGGFSYGDYLRTGAISRFSPIMDSITEYADRGGLVIGICNGFQILTEAGLLPGALVRNRELKFICRDVFLKVENTRTPFTGEYAEGEIIRVPVAHGEGAYVCDSHLLEEMEKEKRIVFRYCDSNGNIDDASNPNGSLNNIAGIVNKQGNVLGMMPHPERCAEEILGNTDGAGIFKSVVKWLKEAGNRNEQ